MAVPNAGLRTLGANFIPTITVTNANLMTFYVRWDLTFAIFNGGLHDGELSGSTSINSDMSQGFTNVQNDIINQMIAFLNARYGVVFGGGQVIFVP